MGAAAMRFVAVQLRYDWERGACLRCRWYGWQRPSLTAVRAVEFAFQGDVVHYDRCQYTISEQDRQYFVSIGMLEADEEADYAFKRDDRLKVLGFRCEPAELEVEPFPAPLLENRLVE